MIFEIFSNGPRPAIKCNIVNILANQSNVETCGADFYQQIKYLSFFIVKKQ